jgi:hypothetical protein
MVYHRRLWWYIVPSVIASSAAAGAICYWEEKKYGKYKPHTMSPCWKLATFRKWWEWPREAASDDPVILNPMRCTFMTHHYWTMHVSAACFKFSQS